MVDLRWEDGVPVSTEFDDPYYSRTDGLAETRHVFLAGNELPERWANGDSFHIAELGFGTGLNFCATWQAWEDFGATGQLNFTSFELHPLDTEAINAALAHWQELEHYTEQLVAVWSPEGGTFTFGNVRLNVVVGDARQTLPQWQGKSDAWFLDGFAPSRNPAMWEEGLLNAVARASAPSATFATYTVAGFVRRGLAAAGFKLEKRAGFGRKHEMLTGYMEICDSSVDGV